MRRTSGRSIWFHAEGGLEKISGPVGDDIARRFELNDFLQTVRDDQALLNSQLKVAPDVRLQQEYEPSAQGWRPAGGRLRRVRGLVYLDIDDPEVADVLLEFDGRRSVAEVLNDFAARRNFNVQTISHEYLGLVHKLIGRAFLWPINSE